MKSHILLLAAGLALAATSASAQVCQGRHLATIEPDGAASAGGKAAVVEAASNGAALRVGWQIGPLDKPHLVHWQDARFVTVFEDEVFVQVGDIHHQFGMRGRAHVGLGKDHSLWNASIGTNGRMVGRLSNEPEPHEMALRTFWCLA